MFLHESLFSFIAHLSNPAVQAQLFRLDTCLWILGGRHGWNSSALVRKITPGTECFRKHIGLWAEKKEQLQERLLPLGLELCSHEKLKIQRKFSIKDRGQPLYCFSTHWGWQGSIDTFTRHLCSFEKKDSQGAGCAEPGWSCRLFCWCFSTTVQYWGAPAWTPETTGLC